MGSLRSHAQFERAGWRLRLLLPLWGLQLALTLTMAGLFAYRLGDSLKHYDDREKSGGIPRLELVWEATNVGLSGIATISTLFEIGKFLAESLTPWTVLFSSIINLTCAIALLVLDAVAHAQKIDGNYTAIGLGLDAVLLCTASGLAIYAIVSYRRLAAEAEYAHALNVKGYGFNDGLHRDNSYSGRFGGGVGGLEKRISSASSRLSFNSARNEQANDVPLQSVERRPSYSHKRDTQFDDFLARRESVDGKGRADVERALGAEFGWSSPPGEKNQEEGVTMGVVKTRARGLSMPRVPSCSSDHVLVSVPEEEESAHRTKAEQDKKDREALLGDERRDSDEHDGSKVAQEVDIPELKWQRE